MIKFFALPTLLALTMAHGHCQELANPLTFEVASVTPCKPGTPEPPGEHAGMVQFIFPGGRLKADCTTPKFLLEWAYRILPAQHSGDPSWFDSDRYQIVAKSSGTLTDEEMKTATQRLLADRFKLKLRRETRDLPALVMSLGKTAPKLFPPKPEEARGLKIVPQMGPDQKISSYHIVATRFSLGQLTDAFARQLGNVILNQTGLDGDFDFTIDLTPDETRPNPLDASLVLSALRDQLGLTVKSQKAPVDFLVVESAEKVTAEN